MDLPYFLPIAQIAHQAALKGEGCAAANVAIAKEAAAINQSLSTLGLVINTVARRKLGILNRDFDS